MTCCVDGFEDYTGRDVSTSALGGIGQLVFYHLSRLTLARDSHGLGIRLLGRGYPRTPQATRLPPECLIHLNPVKAGLAKCPEDGPWSSLHDYTGNLTDPPVTPSGLSVDRGWLPADPRTRAHAFEGVAQSYFSLRKITLRYAMGD
jgi:hypothetical protein